jgi:transposase
MDAVLGIDVAKAKFDVTLQRPDGKRWHKSFPNTPAGLTQLLAWLARYRATRVHATLEATGTYGEALATALHEAGHTVSVLNPVMLHHYAKSQLTRTKTDRVDADLLADYTATQRPPAWTPLPPEVRELQALVRRLDALLVMQTEERNRLQAGGLVPVVQQSIEGVLGTLDAQIAQVRARIRAHMDQHPGLRVKRDLLTSIPGIGETTAAVLLGELFTKSFRSARQAAAFAGLVPHIRESGTRRRRATLSKVGSGRVRKALYFPALAAVRHNPTVRQLSARLRTAGKPSMVILGAAMRKLIHLAFGVLHSERKYDHRLARART